MALGALLLIFGVWLLLRTVVPGQEGGTLPTRILGLGGGS